MASGRRPTGVGDPAPWFARHAVAPVRHPASRAANGSLPAVPPAGRPPGFAAPVQHRGQPAGDSPLLNGDQPVRKALFGLKFGPADLGICKCRGIFGKVRIERFPTRIDLSLDHAPEFLLLEQCNIKRHFIWVKQYARTIAAVIRGAQFLYLSIANHLLQFRDVAIHRCLGSSAAPLVRRLRRAPESPSAPAAVALLCMGAVGPAAHAAPHRTNHAKTSAPPLVVLLELMEFPG
jgi:hypothetical protein